MQEEVENRTVNLAISTSKLTARSLAMVFSKYLRHRSQVKAQKAAGKNVDSKKKTVKELLDDSKKLTNIEVSETDIDGFEKYAKKYKIDYQIKFDESQDPPKYLVFFKADKAKDMTAAFKDYLNSVMQKDKKPSILAQLKKLTEQVRLIPKKVRQKEKEQSL